MAWIEVHQSLPTHRKTLALCDILNIEPVQAVGHLTCLWMWALDNAPDGGLERMTSRIVARAAQWRKDPQMFVDALVQAGFLDAPGHIHDWDDYAGRLIAKREANKSRMKDARATHVQCIDGARGAHVENTTVARAGATVPNRTQPYRTVPNQTPFAADAASPPAPPPFSEEQQRTIDEVTTTLGPFGFKASAELWRKVFEQYGELPLEMEALKQADWLKTHRKRFASVTRYTNWLDNALKDFRQRHPETHETEPVAYPEAEPLPAGVCCFHAWRTDGKMHQYDCEGVA